jgi:hypothetical protein
MAGRASAFAAGEITTSPVFGVSLYEIVAAAAALAAINAVPMIICCVFLSMAYLLPGNERMPLRSDTDHIVRYCIFISNIWNCK